MEIAIKQVIRIIRPGIFCALQDIGRFGYRHLGVPCSGASDRASMIYVNTILQNRPETPVLEIFGAGSIFETISSCTVCFGGAKALIRLNGQEFDFSKPHKCSSGDIIKIEKLSSGTILYLGISGGFYAPPVMESVSYLKDTHLTTFKNGDKLYAHILRNHSIPSGAALKLPLISKTKKIHVFKGPEFDILSNESKAEIFEESFRITPQSNRMGYRLQGHPMSKLSTFEMLTSAVTPGVVQLLPDGQMIILMRDCQTTGGYPRILITDESDINQLAQRSPGDTVHFAIID